MVEIEEFHFTDDQMREFMSTPVGVLSPRISACSKCDSIGSVQHAGLNCSKCGGAFRSVTSWTCRNYLSRCCEKKSWLPMWLALWATKFLGHKNGFSAGEDLWSKTYRIACKNANVLLVQYEKICAEASNGS
jgi:hypothetical protein